MAKTVTMHTDTVLVNCFYNKTLTDVYDIDFNNLYFYKKSFNDAGSVKAKVNSLTKMRVFASWPTNNLKLIVVKTGEYLYNSYMTNRLNGNSLYQDIDLSTITKSGDTWLQTLSSYFNPPAKADRTSEEQAHVDSYGGDGGPIYGFILFGDFEYEAEVTSFSRNATEMVLCDFSTTALTNNFTMNLDFASFLYKNVDTPIDIHSLTKVRFELQGGQGSIRTEFSINGVTYYANQWGNPGGTPMHCEVDLSSIEKGDGWGDFIFRVISTNLTLQPWYIKRIILYGVGVFKIERDPNGIFRYAEEAIIRNWYDSATPYPKFDTIDLKYYESFDKQKSYDILRTWMITDIIAVPKCYGDIYDGTSQIGSGNLSQSHITFRYFRSHYQDPPSTPDRYFDSAIIVKYGDYTDHMSNRYDASGNEYFEYPMYCRFDDSSSQTYSNRIIRNLDQSDFVQQRHPQYISRGDFGSIELRSYNSNAQGDPIDITHIKLKGFFTYLYIDSDASDEPLPDYFVLKNERDNLQYEVSIDLNNASAYKFDSDPVPTKITINRIDAMKIVLEGITAADTAKVMLLTDYGDVVSERFDLSTRVFGGENYFEGLNIVKRHNKWPVIRIITHRPAGDIAALNIKQVSFTGDAVYSEELDTDKMFFFEHLPKDGKLSEKSNLIAVWNAYIEGTFQTTEYILQAKIYPEYVNENYFDIVLDIDFGKTIIEPMKNFADISSLFPTSSEQNFKLKRSVTAGLRAYLCNLSVDNPDDYTNPQQMLLAFETGRFLTEADVRMNSKGMRLELTAGDYISGIAHFAATLGYYTMANMNVFIYLYDINA